LQDKVDIPFWQRANILRRAVSMKTREILGPPYLGRFQIAPSFCLEIAVSAPETPLTRRLPVYFPSGAYRSPGKCRSGYRLQTVGTQALFIEPGSPWENGYCESFNGKLRDKCLNGEVLYSLREAQVVIDMWWKHQNTVCPHSALGYRPPAPLSWMAAA
jgi:putative transposase